MGNYCFNITNHYFGNYRNKTITDANKLGHLGCAVGTTITTAIDTIVALGATLCFVISCGFSNDAAHFASKFAVSTCKFPLRLGLHIRGILGFKTNISFCDNVTVPETVNLTKLTSKIFWHVIVRFGGPLSGIAGTLTLIPLVPTTIIFSSLALLTDHLDVKNVSYSLLYFTGIAASSIFHGLFCLADPTRINLRTMWFFRYMGSSI